MKVLVLTNLFPNPLQPHRAPWNKAQLQALSAGHSVRVISPIAWTDEWAAGRRGADRIPADRRASCGGIAVEHPRYFYPPKMLRGSYGALFRWCTAPAFRRAVRESRPDVVLASWAYPDGLAAVELASQSGLPVVVKVHGSDILALERHPGRIRPTVEALRRADGVVAVSRDLADNVVRLGVPDANVRVVYNGLDTNVFRPGPRREARDRLGLPANRPIILFVGNLVPVKQVDVLLGACRRLHEAGTDFHCHLLGDGLLRGALAEAAASLGLSERVTFQGPRPQAQLVDWYRSADVVALPSRTEGIPNVLLEAAACGTPFVASRVGGIPEIDAGGRCRLVPASDAAALADALARTLAGDLPPLAADARFAHSWEASARQLEDVLRAAAERTRRGAGDA